MKTKAGPAGRSAATKKPPAPKEQSPFLRDALTIIALVVLTFLVYGNASKNGLLNWDDNFYITESPYLKDLSWSGIKAIFSAELMGNYHPLTLLSYALEYAIAGTADPALMHTTNVIFHVLNTVLVFLLGKRLLADHWSGVIMALLFALHPMHVESVAWIAERKDVLYTCFFLLALLSYLRYVKTSGTRAYVLALIFFTLSLLSKSAAATLAPLLFAIDYFLARAWSWRILLEKIPFFALAIGFGVMALSSQEVAMDESFAPHFPLWQRPFIAGYALFFYIVRFFVPYGLSAMHPYPVDPGAGLGPFVGPSIAVVLVLVAALVLAYRSRVHWRITLFGILFFLITLAMVLQLVPVGRAIVADRYTYVPYIGLSLIVAKLVVGVWRSRQGRSSVPYLPAGALTIALIVFAGITAQRIGVWKDSFSVFSDILAKYPEDGLTYYNRGLTYYYEKNYTASIADYNTSIEYLHDRAVGYFNRGLSYKELGDMPAVIRDMDLAIKYQPDYADAFRNRGNAKAMLKDYAGSIADFTTSLEYTPGDTAVLVNRGLAHYFNQDTTKACVDWRSAAGHGSRTAMGLVKDHCAIP